jgi:hypothetical protein
VSEEPLEEEPELDWIVIKSVSVSECMRISDGRRFLLVDESENLEPWEAHSLFWGGDQIIGENFKKSIRQSPSQGEEDEG